MDLMQIPSQLKHHDQWVCWQYELRNNKKTKVPYQANNPKRKAQSTSSLTWATFEDAVNALANNHFDGLGYVFTESAGVVGIDLDNCINESQLSEKAQYWVNKANSYVELSPSGNGLHILVQGALDGKGLNTPAGEIYSTGRFFTVTGDVLADNFQLTENQSLIDEFYDFAAGSKPSAASEPTHSLSLVSDIRPKATANVLENALVREFCEDPEGFDIFMHKNGQKSQSEHDLAICSKAMWMELEPADAFELMYLNRVYFNDNPEKARRGDYLKRTFEKCVSSMIMATDEDVLDESEQMTFTHGEILERVRDVTWLIEGYMPQHGIIWLAAQWSSFKSFLALDIGWAIAQGREWHGNTVNQAQVLYVAGEGFSGLAKRLDGLTNAYGEAAGFKTTEMPFMLTNAQQCRRLVKGVHKEMGEIGLLIIDTKSANMEGSDSDAGTMNEFINNLRMLERELLCTVLVVDHVGHMEKGRARGASQQQGAADLAYLVTRDGESMQIAMSVEKPPKDFEPPLAMTFNAKITELGNDSSTLLLEHVNEHDLSVSNDSTIKFGKYQQLAFNTLTDLIAEAEARADNNKRVEANITVQCWTEAMQALDIHRQSAYKGRKYLLDNGMVERYGSCNQFVRCNHDLL